jgi:hypothetical protein
MEKPSFPLPAGKYMVTGDREVTTELTITEDNKWALKQGVWLHLFRTEVMFPSRRFKASRCRHSARRHALALPLRPLHACCRCFARGWHWHAGSSQSRCAAASRLIRCCSMMAGAFPCPAGALMPEVDGCK